MPEQAAAVNVWRTRPMFITSTFRDMHAERDWLKNHIFPELEERLRARRCHLEIIDLRWGVETVSLNQEQAKEMLVLKVCLNEIERSRPFLIALLGDRYGWIPPEDRMRSAVEEAGFQTTLEGKSITALEIEYGVLKAADQRRRSHFYFRDPLPYEQMDAETAAQFSDAHAPDPEGPARHVRLQALKADIERKMPDRVHRYMAGWDAGRNAVTGLEVFGRMVLEDLWRDLESEIPPLEEQATATWQDQERAALEEFVERGNRDFVGRQNAVRDLMAFALCPAQETQPWGMSVTGPAGSGKSSLFSRLYRLLQKEDVLLLSHAAGISVRSTSADRLLFRWIGELAAFLQVPVPIEENAGPEELESSFARLLFQAGSVRRVVVLLDALNQFEPTVRARHVSWLPKVWSPNARLIATSIPDTASRTLENRPGVAARPLAPLTRPEAERIAEKVCGRYRRRMNPQVLDILMSKQTEDGMAASGNPLWLELALEELNSLDQDDFLRADRQYTGTPEQRLHQLLMDTAERLPAGTEHLYAWMFERAEEIWGAAWVQGLANLIALSRSGWREMDLEHLMPKVTGEEWDPLRFAGLRRSFRAHLVQRGALAQWDFYHSQAKLAVTRRNLTDLAKGRLLHSTIAAHLQGLPDMDPLRQTETMVHLIGADDRLGAVRWYTGDLKAPELEGATQVLAQQITAGEARAKNEELNWIISLLALPKLDNGTISRLANRFQFELNAEIENRVALAARKTLLQAVLAAATVLAQADPSNAGWQRDLSVSHNKIGDVLLAQGDLAGALAAYRQSLGVRERLAQADPSNAGWQRDLWVSYWRMGSIAEQTGDSEAPNWLRRAYETLRQMKQRGLFISPQDEAFFAQLEEKVHGTGKQ